jgi:hypothetical protein
MSATTFSQALAEAAVLAYAAMPDKREKIDAGVQLVRDGKVFERDDGVWEVESTSTPGTVYTPNGNCPCPDSHFRGDICKHRMAVYLSRKAVQITHPTAAPQAPKITESVIVPEAPPAPKTGNLPELPEARASLNFKAMVGQYEVMVTLRGDTEAELFERLAQVLKRPDVQPIPRPQPRAQGQQWRGKRQYQGTS